MKKSQNTWNILERTVLMKNSFNYKEFILHLLLCEATVWSDPRDLGNPAFFLCLSWKLKDDENSASHGQLVKYRYGLLIIYRLFKIPTCEFAYDSGPDEMKHR